MSIGESAVRPEAVTNIFLILLAVLLSIGIGTVLLSFVLFTRLVRFLHDRYPDEWIRVGKPVGFFWRPAEYRSWNLSDQWRSGFATNWASKVWVLRKPEWIKRSPDTERVFARFRAAVLIWYLVFFLMLLAIFHR